LQNLFIARYIEATSSAVENAHVVWVAGRRAIVFTSEGAHAGDPSGRFYLVIGSQRVVQIYCVYGGQPDQMPAIIGACEQIARTLEIRR
jgi:hypothetical protein